MAGTATRGSRPRLTARFTCATPPVQYHRRRWPDIFGKYGAIRQIRLGDKRDTRGTAYVVYEDIYDAKNAVITFRGSTLRTGTIVLYYNPAKTAKKRDAAKEEAELKALQAKHGVMGRSGGL